MILYLNKLDLFYDGIISNSNSSEIYVYNYIQKIIFFISKNRFFINFSNKILKIL